MLQEGIREFERIVHQGNMVQLLPVDREPPHVYYLRIGDELRRCEAEPPPRQHTTTSLESLANIAMQFATESNDVAVWYGRQGIVALLDDTTRRDRVTLHLRPSKQMEVLTMWDRNVTWLDQWKLFETMRICFGHYINTPGIIDSIRRLRFRLTSTGEKTIEHGRQSIGKSLEAELTGVKDIPEEISFTVPAFDGGALGVYCHITTVVQVNPEAEKIALIPEAGAIERSWLRVENEIGGLLLELIKDNEHIHMYQGGA